MTQKVRKTTFVFSRVMMLFLVLPAIAMGSPPSVIFHSNGKVDIQAEKAPLIQVLQVLSEQTGITLKIEDLLSEPVTVQLRSVSVEDGIDRLMTDINYALIFKKDAGGQIVPAELCVLARQGKIEKGKLPAAPSAATGSASKIKNRMSSAEPAASETPLPTFSEKEYSGQDLDDIEKLSRTIAMESVEITKGNGGVKINQITKDSIFSKIGLAEGDTILKVNEYQILSKRQFLETLHSSNRMNPFRIEYMKGGGQKKAGKGPALQPDGPVTSSPDPAGRYVIYFKQK